MAWWTRHWEDIRPQLKFEFAKWLLSQIATGATLGAVVGLYHYFRTTTTDWHGFVYVFVLSSVLLIALRWPRRKPSGQGSPPAPVEQKPVTTLVGQETTFLKVETFYKTYDNRLLLECESNIRAFSDKYEPGEERERFLIRYFASTLMVGIFEYIWIAIFRSQIRLLEALNKAPMVIQAAEVFYDAAQTQDNAAFYGGYPFSAWLSFMKTWLLVTEELNGILQITVRGREFLKYLVETGRTLNERYN